MPIMQYDKMTKPDLAQLIDRITALQASIAALVPITALNKQMLDKKFRLEFNYNSNHLEGNTLTYNETELLLIFDRTNADHTFRELDEMKGHDVAFRLVTDLATDVERPLTETFIKELNKILLVRPFWKDAITSNGVDTRREIQVGSYKQYPNNVRLANGEIFQFASPEETPAEMGDLLNWYKENIKQKHPVELAALLHYKLVCIHPFDDGNGRVSRLLMNYILLKNNLPPVVIKSNDKNAYLAALNKADTGNTDAFVAYIASQLLWSLDITIKATMGESIEELDDLDKEIDLLNKQIKVREAEKDSPELRQLVLARFMKDVWEPIIKLAQKFNSVFTNIIISDESQANNITQLKINLKGLKGAPNGTNINITAEITFTDFRYYIYLNAAQKSIANVEFNYSDGICQTEVENYITALKNHLLASIKFSMTK